MKETACVGGLFLFLRLDSLFMTDQTPKMTEETKSNISPF